MMDENGTGFDLKKLLELVAPVVGGLAMHGPSQAGFQQGWVTGQHLARQEREHKQQLEQKRRDAGANFMLDIGQHAERFDDPVAFANYIDLAEHAGTKAGYIKPGELKAGIGNFPEGKNAARKLKELNDQLDTLEKGGYSLDELAQSGSHLELKDGTSVPLATAIDLTRKRPMGADNKPIPRPAKTASTEEERFVTKRAKDYGYGSTDEVDADTQLEWRREFRDAGRADKTEPRVSPGGVDAQFNDLVSLWEEKHPGQKAPTAVRTQLRVQAKKEIGQADDRSPITVSLPGMAGMTAAERVESAADDLIANRMAPSQLATFFTGMGKESASQLRSLVMQRVKQKQPDFNFAQAEANYKFGSAAGTQSTVRFLDNIEKTLPVLQQASDDFTRSGVRVINKALLAGKSQFGNTDVVKFEFARNILADEIAKILQGGGTGSGTSDAKLHQAQELLSGDMTPQQFSTALTIAQELLATRRGSLTSGTFMEKKGGAAPATTPKKIGRFDVVPQ